MSYIDALRAVQQAIRDRQAEAETVLTARRAQKIRLPETGSGGDADAGPLGGPDDGGGGGTWVAPDGTPYYERPDGEWVKGTLPEGTGDPTVSGTLAPNVPRLIRRPDLDFEGADLLSPEARLAFQAGGLSDMDSFLVGQALGFTPSFLQDRLFGDGGGGGGGGGAYDAMYADMARQKFEAEMRQNELDNLAALTGLTMKQDMENEARRQQQAQQMAALAPYMTGGRTFAGGWEPTGPAAALANYAGVAFYPQRLQTVDIPTGYTPMDNPELAQLRALIGG